MEKRGRRYRRRWRNRDRGYGRREVNRYRRKWRDRGRERRWEKRAKGIQKKMERQKDIEGERERRDGRREEMEREGGWQKSEKEIQKEMEGWREKGGERRWDKRGQQIQIQKEME